MTPTLLATLLVLVLLAAPAVPTAPTADVAIVLPPPASALRHRAARELARYVYLRSGRVPSITQSPSARGDAIVINTDATGLDEQEFRLRTATADDGRRILNIAGGSDIATLWGAYRLAEHMGVRFYLHGDVVPDRPVPDWRVPRLDERSAPLFRLRGIQPFHDFPEGPDWWSLDDYKAHLSQLAKMRMNFFGLHCYPEGGVGPEPLVWIGLPGDMDDRGRVTFSYPSGWASTAGGRWGYAPLKTSEFAAGASLLFEQDDFGPDVTAGHRPTPTTPDGCNEVFNRAAAMMAAAFAHGRALGVKLCIGTETPLTIPAAVKARLSQQGLAPEDPATVRALYEGIFKRLQRACPVDYYWLWTPEGWTWSGAATDRVEATVRDIQMALEALDRAGRPFDLATCGWVLGPPRNRMLFDQILPRDASMSCINRDVGFDPVEPGFALIDGRPQWAIPWLEDDPAMIIPQLWAGRMRRDAADAHAYGCTGLMGIHWRTRSVAPTVAALAQAAWSQSGWNPDFGKPVDPPRVLTTDVHVGGDVARHAQADEDPVHRTCRWNVDGYAVRVPNGVYDVTLQFCEIHHTEPGRVFGVRIEGRPIVERLDVLDRVGHLVALDLTFENVAVEDEELSIDFERQVEFPFIAGIVIHGRDGDSRAFARRINCGGPAVGAYEADLPPAGIVVDQRGCPRDMPVEDFYSDWAAAEFGPEAAEPLAALFARLDGSPPSAGPRASSLPRPADWDRGPGGIKPNRTPWEVERERYRFVQEMESLRPRVVGKGQVDRFDYWLNRFRYLRAVGHLGCTRGALDAVIDAIRAEDPERKASIARERAIPLRVGLARKWEQMVTLQLAVASTPGDLGTIANLEQHVRRHNAFLSLHDAFLNELVGPLPPEVEPRGEFAGAARIFVPTVRPDIDEGERLHLKVIALSAQPPTAVTVHFRAMGEGSFHTVTCDHLGRGVYRGELPPADGIAIEYYVSADLPGGETCLWPATAPEVNQTVIVIPHSSNSGP